MVGTALPARVFEALADSYRRQLLVALLTTNQRVEDHFDPMGLVADGGIDEPVASRVQVVHVHLPKLVDMGFVEWDREAGVVSTGPNWAEIEPLLELLHEHRAELPEGWSSDDADAVGRG